MAGLLVIGRFVYLRLAFRIGIAIKDLAGLLIEVESQAEVAVRGNTAGAPGSPRRRPVGARPIRAVHSVHRFVPRGALWFVRHCEGGDARDLVTVVNVDDAHALGNATDQADRLRPGAHHNAFASDEHQFERIAV